jgi:hypothetical protein
VFRTVVRVTFFGAKKVTKETSQADFCRDFESA